MFSGIRRPTEKAGIRFSFIVARPMKQVLLCLLVLSQLVIITYGFTLCHKHRTCEACQTSTLCEWCLDETLVHGKCQSLSDGDDLLCPRRLRDTCAVDQVQRISSVVMCESYQDCGACLDSEWDCKYCPEQSRCLSAQSEASCATPFVTSDNESECPDFKHDAGSSLTPFACIIVLFSFLIMVL